jgi:hypothetical protein
MIDHAAQIERGQREIMRIRRPHLPAGLDPGHALNADAEQREAHLAAVGAALRKDNVWRLQEWMHHNLIVLDYKATAVLQFNAILLAAVVFLGGQSGNDALLPRIALVLAVVLILTVVWGVMRFNWVYWSSTEDFEKPDRMLHGLLELREHRTRVVRRAWFAGMLALLLVGTVLIANLVGLTQGATAPRPDSAGFQAAHVVRDTEIQAAQPRVVQRISGVTK